MNRDSYRDSVSKYKRYNNFEKFIKSYKKGCKMPSKKFLKEKVCKNEDNLKIILDNNKYNYIYKYIIQDNKDINFIYKIVDYINTKKKYNNEKNLIYTIENMFITFIDQDIDIYIDKTIKLYTMLNKDIKRNSSYRFERCKRFLIYNQEIFSTMYRNMTDEQKINIYEQNIMLSDIYGFGISGKNKREIKKLIIQYNKKEINKNNIIIIKEGLKDEFFKECYNQEYINKIKEYCINNNEEKIYMDAIIYEYLELEKEPIEVLDELLNKYDESLNAKDKKIFISNFLNIVCDNDIDNEYNKMMLEIVFMDILNNVSVDNLEIGNHILENILIIDNIKLNNNMNSSFVSLYERYSSITDVKTKDIKYLKNLNSYLNRENIVDKDVYETTKVKLKIMALNPLDNIMKIVPLFNEYLEYVNNTMEVPIDESSLLVFGEIKDKVDMSNYNYRNNYNNIMFNILKNSNSYNLECPDDLFYTIHKQVIDIDNENFNILDIVKEQGIYFNKNIEQFGSNKLLQKNLYTELMLNGVKYCNDKLEEIED